MDVDRVLGFAEALGVVLDEARHVEAMPAERVALLDAQFRVLSQEVRADRDQPPFDRSTRDGFAMRAGDKSESLRVAGSVRAGEMWRGSNLRDGEAIEIMTGAPLPEGAGCVVMVEHVQQSNDRVRLQPERTMRAGENVVGRGSEAREGDVVLTPGSKMQAAEIAVAASLGYTELMVHGQPRVSIVATGDELVELEETPEAWQIRNSNSYGLAALVHGEGAIAERLEIARDTERDVAEQIAQASSADLMVLSGGVSMGKYDLVEGVLRDAGAEFFFTGALIQPGKPVVFGRVPRPKQPGAWTYFFGLPGNPVSTQVTFLLFVAPMLRALMGRRELAPVFAEARLGENVRGGAKVTRFLPAEMRGGWDGVTVRPVAWQGSGDLAANARSNAYVVLPAGVEQFDAGQTVRVLLR